MALVARLHDVTVVREAVEQGSVIFASPNAKKNDLLDWTPKAPMLMCCGPGDSTIQFAVHQEAAAAAFRARGYASLTPVDVDPQVQTAFGIDGKAPRPTDPNYAAYVGSYHAMYAGAFCHPMARGFLETYR